MITVEDGAAIEEQGDLYGHGGLPNF